MIVRAYEPPLPQMPAEEFARDRKHAGALFSHGLGPTAGVLADLHPERAGLLIEISSIEERVWQAVNQAERPCLARSFQRFVQQKALAMGDGTVRETVHNQKWGRVLAHVGQGTGRAYSIRHRLHGSIEQARLS